MTVKAPQIPSNDAPVTDQDGVALVAWYLFLTVIWQPPPAFEDVDAGTSPLTYQASYPGSVHISGGTVSAVELIRGRDSILTGQTSGFFPVGLGDQLEITYSVAPDIVFIPR